MPAKPAKNDLLFPKGRQTKSSKTKRHKLYEARRSRIRTILDRTAKARAEIDAVIESVGSPLGHVHDSLDEPRHGYATQGVAWLREPTQSASSHPKGPTESDLGGSTTVTGVEYSSDMSLHDTTQDRVVLKVTSTTYEAVLYEAMKRRRSPDAVTDELVNEALDRAVSAAKIGEAVAELAQEAGMDGVVPPIVIPESESDVSLERMKREHILRVLNESDGNISEAARRLDVHRASLQRILRRFGVDPATLARKVQIAPQMTSAPAPTPSPAPSVERCEHDNPVDACRQSAACFERMSNKQGQRPTFGPPCDIGKGNRCPNPLYWRGRARCGCSRPSRSAA